LENTYPPGGGGEKYGQRGKNIKKNARALTKKRRKRKKRQGKRKEK
jgi:hypothetical protein